jgi:hypothetical protein
MNETTTTETTLLEPIDARIQEFIRLFRVGYEAWVAAGRILAEMIDIDPATIDKICNEYPDLPRKLLHDFEKVGRGVHDPRVLILADSLTSTLRKMPGPIQTRLLDGEPVEVLVQTEQGPDTLLIRIQDMTPEQRRLSLDEFGPVPLSRQRAIHAQDFERAAVKTLTAGPGRLIAGKKVELPAGTYTAKQLRQILKDMEGAWGA